MPRKTKRAGVGAKCSVIIRFVHPSREVSKVIQNSSANERLNDLLLIKEDRRNVNHRESTCYVFRHEKFESIELYAAKRLVKIEVEGPEDGFFGKVHDSSTTISNVNTTATSNLNGGVSNGTNIGEGEIIDPVVFNTRNCKEDIAMVRSLGMTVDDDNDPAPENIPDLTSITERQISSVEDLYPGQSWGWNGFDERKKENFVKTEPKINGLSGIALEGVCFVKMFLLFFPNCIINLIIKETSKKMEVGVIYGEFLRFIGIILFWSTTSCSNCREFWSSRPVDINSGAPY